MIFLLLLIIPMLIASGFFIFGDKKVVWQEFLIHILAQLFVAGVCIGIIYTANTFDTEIWNGKVLSKTRQVVHCRHSYQCHCVEVCSGSGKNETCHQVCQTCYDHSFDIDWDFTTSDNGISYIDTIDRQGLQEPPRWTKIIIGEPSSSSHIYTNYIKASEGTLFKRQGLVDKYKQYIPKYPNTIYDYYRINRVVGINSPNINYNNFNILLSKLNSEIGQDKQVNVVVVFVNNLPQEFYYALEQAWIGGKKNDFIVVIGIEDTIIKWTTVMAWVDDEYVKIKTRDDIITLSNINNYNSIIDVIQNNIISFYKRKPMHDFAYLQSSIVPTTTELIVSLIINIIVSIGLGFLFLNNDFFEV